VDDPKTDNDKELGTASTHTVAHACDMLTPDKGDADRDMRNAFEALVRSAATLLARPADTEDQRLKAHFSSFVDRARSLLSRLAEPDHEIERASTFLTQAKHALCEDIHAKLALLMRWVSDGWSVYDEVNIFSVLDIARQENPQSLFLKWLLLPNGSHGLGDAFLSRFLRKACELCSVSYGGVLDRVQVTAQKEIDDVGILDIIIEGDDFVCVIENKVAAGEGTLQLTRYADYAERCEIGKTKRGIGVPLLVYLVPMPDKLPKEERRFRQMLYSDIVDLVTDTLEQTPCLPEVRCVVEMFIHNIRRSILREMDDLLQARSLLQQISECYRRSDQAVNAEMYDALCRLAAVATQEMKT